MFDDQDTPWDMLLKMSATLESLCRAHNMMAEDYEKTCKKILKQQAQIDELRRLLLATDQAEQDSQDSNTPHS